MPIPKKKGTTAAGKAKKSTAYQEDLLRRAFAAYFRTARGEEIDQPSKSSSSVELRQDKAYVVLRNARAVLTVYRVRNDDMLRRMTRWPKNVE
jgi:hypothetical protein